MFANQTIRKEIAGKCGRIEVGVSVAANGPKDGVARHHADIVNAVREHLDALPGGPAVVDESHVSGDAVPVEGVGEIYDVTLCPPTWLTMRGV